MNCSSTTDMQSPPYLCGNFGATVFMAAYIGFYGMGIIVYYTYQFMADAGDNINDDTPSDFFTTFHQINQRQEIYNRLSDREWITAMYTVYFSDQLLKTEDIDAKAKQCAQKYHEKMLNLRSRQTYYTTEISIRSTPTLVLSIHS